MRFFTERQDGFDFPVPCGALEFSVTLARGFTGLQCFQDKFGLLIPRFSQENASPKLQEDARVEGR